MTKLKIANLYYDIMNLYGENANIRALVKFAEYQGIQTEVHNLTIGDKIDFEKYDIYYIGSGTEKSELLVLKDIMNYQNEIRKAIMTNKHFLVTGNAIEFFGEYININEVKYPALNIFPYRVLHENYRIVGSVVMSMTGIKEKIIGFQNRCGIMIDDDRPLFKVIEGTGCYINSNKEGYWYRNFFGTYIFGPLLIRNPHFTNYLLKSIMSTKNKKYKFKIINNIPEIEAYNKYIENFNIKNRKLLNNKFLFFISYLSSLSIVSISIIYFTILPFLINNKVLDLTLISLRLLALILSSSPIILLFNSSLKSTTYKGVLSSFF